MQLSKQQCRDLAPDNFVYGGFWDGYYHFQSGGYVGTTDYSTGEKHQGFKPMACLPEDMTAKNLALMAKMGLTRIIDHNYS